MSVPVFQLWAFHADGNTNSFVRDDALFPQPFSHTQATMTTTSSGPSRSARRIRIALAAVLALVAFSVTSSLSHRPRFEWLGAQWERDCYNSFVDARQNRPLEFYVSQVATHLGDKLVLLSISGVFAVILFRRRQIFLALTWLAVTMGGMMAIEFTKYAAARPRPTPELTFVMSPSFPSGHAGGTALVFGMAAYLLWNASVRGGKPAAMVLFALIPLVGYTRLVLGVHWLTDVFGGWSLGAGFVLLGIAAIEVRRLVTSPPANTPAMGPSP